jgi:hypothetical protein
VVRVTLIRNANEAENYFDQLFLANTLKEIEEGDNDGI